MKETTVQSQIGNISSLKEIDYLKSTNKKQELKVKSINENFQKTRTELQAIKAERSTLEKENLNLVDK